MIFDDEIPKNGKAEIYFSLSEEVVSSQNSELMTTLGSLDTELGEIHNHKGLESLRLFPISFSTARVVLGSRGDSRISDLIVEVGYTGLTASNFAKFYGVLRELVVREDFPLLKGVKIHVTLDDQNQIRKASIVTVSVTFYGYEAWMQNETRKMLSGRKEVGKKGLSDHFNEILGGKEWSEGGEDERLIIPYYWALVRHIKQDVKDSQITVGAKMKYLVNKINEEQFNLIRKQAEKKAESVKMLAKSQVYLETYVWGYEE